MALLTTSVNTTPSKHNTLLRGLINLSLSRNKGQNIKALFDASSFDGGVVKIPTRSTSRNLGSSYFNLHHNLQLVKQINQEKKLHPFPETFFLL